jgi:hypothetical protein
MDMKRTAIEMSRAVVAMLGAVPITLLANGIAVAGDFGLPARCDLGENCFFQQYVDMDAGKQARDPLCGMKTYDGHKGTDLRILSMRDVERRVPVLAVGEGRVLRVRDGEEDHLMETQSDRAAVEGKECGNGLVMSLKSGYEVQYCHMRKDSLMVRAGDIVNKGQQLGEVGASGMAQFPHVHITVRKGDEIIDPLTGRTMAEGCSADAGTDASLFEAGIVGEIDTTAPEILAMGIAGAPIKHDDLVRQGPPPVATAKDQMFVAWVWLANLEKGDRIRIALKSDDGSSMVELTTEPVDRNKASYSAFAGKRRSLPAGDYEATVAILRQDNVVETKTGRYSVPAG